MKKNIAPVLTGIITIMGVFLCGCGEQSLPSAENENKISEEVKLYQRYADGQMDYEEYMYELERALVENKLGKDFSEEKIKQLQEASRKARELKGTGILTQEIIQKLDEKNKEILTPEEYNKYMDY
jgi:hypothetical protein